MINDAQLARMNQNNDIDTMLTREVWESLTLSLSLQYAMGKDMTKCTKTYRSKNCKQNTAYAPAMGLPALA